MFEKPCYFRTSIWDDVAEVSERRSGADGGICPGCRIHEDPALLVTGNRGAMKGNIGKVIEFEVYEVEGSNVAVYPDMATPVVFPNLPEKTLSVLGDEPVPVLDPVVFRIKEKAT